MGVIVIYLRIRNRFSFLDVTVRIGSCSHSCSLLNSTKGSKKKNFSNRSSRRDRIGNREKIWGIIIIIILPLAPSWAVEKVWPKGSKPGFLRQPRKLNWNHLLDLPLSYQWMISHSQMLSANCYYRCYYYSSSPFFVKLMENTDREIEEKKNTSWSINSLFAITERNPS